MLPLHVNKVVMNEIKSNDLTNDLTEN